MGIVRSFCELELESPLFGLTAKPEHFNFPIHKGQ